MTYQRNEPPTVLPVTLPGELLVDVVGMSWNGAVIHINGYRFINCRFENCRFTMATGGHGEFVDCLMF